MIAPRHFSRIARRSLHLAAAGAISVLTACSFIACGEEAPAADGRLADTPGGSVTPVRTPEYVADVINSWPHDTGAFTQGLQWHDDRLFESTGREGFSSIREVDLTTGRVLRKHDIDRKYFGEGMVILGDDLYQITWENEQGFVYDWKTFKPKREFTYSGQGWGLTTDGTSLIMSNGSSAIVYRDPKTFAITKQLDVAENGTPVAQLNELEWVKGEIWANVWQRDQLARIDATTGKVIGWINLAGLLAPNERTGKEDVLNGVAYDEKRDRIFVTGKLWPRLYEIKLKPR